MHWRPFQLRPDTPPGGVALSTILPPEYLAQAEARLRQATAEANLPFNRPSWVPNTHLAHEAAMFAAAHGCGDAFHQAALNAYFGSGRDVGDKTVLMAIGQEVGLNPDELLSALDSGRYREAVDREFARAQAVGVQSVPSFIFGSTVGFAGAQPYEAFERAIRAVGAK